MYTALILEECVVKIPTSRGTMSTRAFLEKNSP